MTNNIQPVYFPVLLVFLHNSLQFPGGVTPGMKLGTDYTLTVLFHVGLLYIDQLFTNSNNECDRRPWSTSIDLIQR